MKNFIVKIIASVIIYLSSLFARLKTDKQIAKQEGAQDVLLDKAKEKQKTIHYSEPIPGGKYTL